MIINVKPEIIELPWIGDVHSSVVISFMVLVGLIIFCLVVNWQVRNRFKEVPGRFQLIVEFGVDSLREYARKMAGHAGDDMAPWVLTVALFIGMNCLVEFFSFEPPTGDLSVTLMLGLLTFFVINIMGLKYKKLSGRLHHYIEPTPIVAPFKIIADLAIPISLACRLYGNVLSGMIVMTMIYQVIPIAVPAALSIYFTLFHTLIQTYVFITLTLSFVKEAVE